MNLNDFWAKTSEDGQPGISVLQHCLNVGFVAERLIQIMPRRLQEFLPPEVNTLVALHDIGKITPGFQMKCPTWLAKWQNHLDSQEWGRSEANHALVSQFFLQNRNRKWAVAVGAHHGRILRNSAAPFKIDEASGEIFSTFRKELFLKIETILGPLQKLENPTEHARWFVAGLITVADWLGSNENFFPLDGMGDLPPISVIRNRADKSLVCINWEPKTVIKGLNFEAIFSDASSGRKLSPNPLQKAVSAHISKPGFYLLEGPMGCGKTEAALLAAYNLIQQGHHHGLYFGLPTQVTSNRIFRRVEKFLVKIHSDPALLNVRLVHANSWLKNTEISFSLRERDKHFWFTPVKRALLAQYGVGTIDQALLGIVRAKHFFVRQFGLAGKVVILDEVHSYDLYTGTLIDHLIKRLLKLGCTVLVLSATLTEQRRKTLFAAASTQIEHLSNVYPLLSGAIDGRLDFEAEVEAPSERTVNISCISRAPAELAEECLSKAREGACVLWIRNTVNEAQEAWIILKSQTSDGGPEIGLLHSRFPQWRRDELEEKWIDALSKDSTKRPRGCVLVSTQVVEQSVDIDADFLITDLAPTDMLFQRLGRLWRHERPENERPPTHAEAWIIAPNLNQLVTSKEIRISLGKSGKVYAGYILLRTYKVWSQLSLIQLPRDIRPLLEKTYELTDPSEPKIWGEFADEIDKFRDKQRDIADAMTRIESDPTLDDKEGEGIQTRWNSRPTASLLLLRSVQSIDHNKFRIEPLYGKSLIISAFDKNFSSARAIHENIVKVPYWSIKDGCDRAPGWLTHYVQGCCAAATIVNGKVIFLTGNASSSLNWHIDEGISIRSPKKHLKMDDDDEPCD